MLALGFSDLVNRTSQRGYNPHVRYAAAMALGIACAGTALLEAECYDFDRFWHFVSVNSASGLPLAEPCSQDPSSTMYKISSCYKYCDSAHFGFRILAVTSAALVSGAQSSSTADVRPVRLREARSNPRWGLSGRLVNGTMSLWTIRDRSETVKWTSTFIYIYIID